MTRKLLLADDSITIQKVVELVLAEEDFEIKSVGNGEEALNLLASFKPDIVLADIEMPKLNGYQLCERIKTAPATSSVPVILLAGAFEPIDTALARKVGADDSVIKPFESQELISKINAVLTMGAAEAEPAAIEEAETFAEAEAVAEEDAFEFGEEVETVAAVPESGAAVADEDLWAMEDISEAPEEFAAEEIAEEEAFVAEAVEETEIAGVPEELPREIPRPAPVMAAAPIAAPVKEQPAVRTEVAAPAIVMPTREEVLAAIDKKVGEQAAALFSSLDLKDALIAAITPMLKDSVEKILWEMAPELVEKVTRETIGGAFSSISSEVEKVLWETVPELAGTIISKEIEKIKAAF